MTDHNLCLFYNSKYVEVELNYRLTNIYKTTYITCMVDAICVQATLFPYLSFFHVCSGGYFTWLLRKHKCLLVSNQRTDGFRSSLKALVMRINALPKVTSALPWFRNWVAGLLDHCSTNWAIAPHVNVFFLCLSKGLILGSWEQNAPSPYLTTPVVMLHANNHNALIFTDAARKENSKLEGQLWSYQVWGLLWAWYVRQGLHLWKHVHLRWSPILLFLKH